MNLKTLLLLSLVFCAFAVPAFATRDSSTMVLYYDSSGNIIGTCRHTCTLDSCSGDTSGDNYVVSVISSCSMIGWQGCDANGLSEVGPCGSNWCASDVYYEYYIGCFVPDCNGNYYGSCNLAKGPAKKKNPGPSKTAVRPLFLDLAGSMK